MGELFMSGFRLGAICGFGVLGLAAGAIVTIGPPALAVWLTVRRIPSLRQRILEHKAWRGIVRNYEESRSA